MTAETTKPNIVFIMADDLGAGRVNYDGSNPAINTPNLERIAKSGMVFTRAYAAGMDNAVGKVLDTLKATGTLDNTMVVFYSDNGGHVPTKWLAEKKCSLLEGGLRVPTAVRWPGVIKGGTTCHVPVTSGIPVYDPNYGRVPPQKQKR